MKKHYNESGTMRRLLTFTRLIISVQSICLSEENNERTAGPAHTCEENNSVTLNASLYHFRVQFIRKNVHMIRMGRFSSGVGYVCLIRPQ